MRHTAIGLLLVLGVGCASVASAPTVPENRPNVTSPSKDDDGREQRPSVPTISSPLGPLPSLASTTTTPLPLEARRVTMAFTGDTLTHSPLWAQAQENAGGAGYDFRPMQARLRPLLDNADLAVCHLETPIAPEGEEFTTAPQYGVPAEVVDSLLIAGYDRCSTASNHTVDRGTAGIDRTVNVLESRGIEQSGMARTPEEIAPSVFDVDGVAVSHLAYTYGFNGITLPTGEEWRSALIEPERIITDAKAARMLGAEIVVVSMHWGEERIAEPTENQRYVAEVVTASGAVDLIVGHHAHVLQPIENLNGRWVLYGLSNIIADLSPLTSWPAESQDAAVAMVTFTVDPDGAVSVGRPLVHPTFVDRDAGWVVRLVQPDLADPLTPEATRAQLYASLQRTNAVLGEFVARR